MPHRIEKIRLFISREPDGEEGLVAFRDGGGWVPLVSSDEERAEIYRRVAQEIARCTGHTILEVEFATRTEVGEIKP